MTQTEGDAQAPPSVEPFSPPHPTASPGPATRTTGVRVLVHLAPWCALVQGLGDLAGGARGHARLDDHRAAVNTAQVKTTFDLPDSLLRKAKALASQQGRPLRDLVAEAISEKLAGAAEGRRVEWERWKARLVQLPDGSWLNPEGVEDESFFRALDDIRQAPWISRETFGSGS